METNTYFITNDNKVYTNGKFLMEFDDFSPLSSFRRVKRDSGGFPSLCHYYDDGRYQDYTFNCYSSMEFSWEDKGMSPGGNRISKVIRRGNSFFDSAKSAVDSFQSDYRTANYVLGVFIANLVIAGYTVRNIPALIINGTTLGLEALGVLIYYNSAKNQIERAYNYIRSA